MNFWWRWKRSSCNVIKSQQHTELAFLCTCQSTKRVNASMKYQVWLLQISFSFPSSLRLLRVTCPSDHLFVTPSQPFRIIFADLFHTLLLHWTLIRNMDPNKKSAGPQWRSLVFSGMRVLRITNICLFLFKSLSTLIDWNKSYCFFFFDDLSVGNDGKL